jgi:hypothetical protein
MKALAETWRVISLADLAARTGGGPSAIGYQLERADLYAHRYENGHVTKIRQTRGGMPCRDDSRLWNATGRVLTDGGPDRRERFEATLTDREREVYLAGRSEAATTTATRLGISMREWRRTWQRINAKLRETK